MIFLSIVRKDLLGLNDTSVRFPCKGNRQLEAGGGYAAGAGGFQARLTHTDGPRSIGHGS
ncbi:MAG: hypothetical protein WBB65_00335 [Anaerolineales bacterium]|nr:hypothetical protein [Anaerolineales bacterium]